jgi:septal ring factor EnvC (AmiA/AmiB activator)
MRSAGAWLSVLSVSVLIAGFSAGCGPAPPCETSLVTLDETRLDVETYEQEAAETGARVADLKARLEEKRREIDAIKDKPTELEKKVYELKKGSGRE